MNLKIRYLGMIISETELSQDKTYILGRDQKCDIRLTKDFISREHAKIYFEEGKWWYQDLRNNHPHYRIERIEINDVSMIELENDIDILTEEYLNSHSTKVYDFKDLRNLSKQGNKTSKWIKWSGAVASLGAIAIGAQYYMNILNGPMNSEKILSHVSERFVAFELTKNESLEEKLISISKLKKEDFKKEVGFCSGFIVAPKIVMSASHCILGANGITPMENFHLKTHDGVHHKISKVLGVDLTKDLILIEVDSMINYKHFDIEDKHKIGQKVFTIGNVHGEGMAIRDGSISSMTEDPNNPEISYLRFSAGASPGNSGGPLVNEFGKVIGLVFARANSAENYNLSSPHYELKEFISKYHLDRDPKEITINTEDTIFGANLFNLYSKLELMNNSAYGNLKLNEDQEKIDKLNKVSFNMKFPIEFDPFKKIIINKTEKTLESQFTELVQKNIKDNNGGLTWVEQVTEKKPVLVPRDLNNTYLTIFDMNEKFFWESNILILEPGQFNEFDKKKLTYKTNYKDNVFHKDMDEKLKSKFPLQLFTQSYSSFSNLFNYDSTWVEIDYTNNEVAKLDEEVFKKSFIREKGIPFSPYYLGYQYIRPKKIKEIKIKDFKFENHQEIKDKYGRTWEKSELNLLDGLYVMRYCYNYPQAKMCINKPFLTTSSGYLKHMQINFENYKLSEMMLDLNFWTLDALDNYYQNESNISFEYTGADFKKSEAGFEIKNLFFNKSYKIKKEHNVAMVKLLPGVIRTEDGNTQWVNLGHQTYHPAKKGQSAKICRTEINFPNHKTSYLANLYHDQKNYDDIAKRKMVDELKKTSDLKRKKELQRKIASMDKGNNFKHIQYKKFKTPQWNEELEIFSSCREIFKDKYNKNFIIDKLVPVPKGLFD